MWAPYYVASGAAVLRGCVVRARASALWAPRRCRGEHPRPPDSTPLFTRPHSNPDSRQIHKLLAGLLDQSQLAGQAGALRVARDMAAYFCGRRGAAPGPPCATERAAEPGCRARAQLPTPPAACVPPLLHYAGCGGCCRSMAPTTGTRQGRGSVAGAWVSRTVLGSWQSSWCCGRGASLTRQHRPLRWQVLETEFGGMNEVLYRLYRLTKDPDHAGTVRGAWADQPLAGLVGLTGRAAEPAGPLCGIQAHARQAALHLSRPLHAPPQSARTGLTSPPSLGRWRRGTTRCPACTPTRTWRRWRGGRVRARGGWAPPAPCAASPPYPTASP